MDDLASWLTAQLDEDARTTSSWHTLDCDIHAHLEGDAESVTATMAMFHEAPGLVCDCGGPARILREIDAKRRILDECAYWDDKLRQEAANPPKYPQPGLGERLEVATPILRLLALPYADRPGYLEKWRP